MFTLLVIPLIISLLFAFTYLATKVVKYFKTKESDYLISAFKPWVYLVLCVGLMVLANWYYSKVSVSKSEIIGNYEVDTKLYSGKNAEWQKMHYRFEITPDSKFILYERLSDNSERMHTGSVTWANEDPEKWSIKIENAHQVIDKHPVLYRTNRKFYYVFRTKYFGNMFFKKNS